MGLQPKFCFLTKEKITTKAHQFTILEIPASTFTNLDVDINDAIATDETIATLTEHYTTGNRRHVANALITYIHNIT